MLEEVGVVSEITQQDGQQVIVVDTEVKTTCGSCQAKDNCGTSTIAKILSKKRETLSFSYAGDVSVGQQVRLGIPEQRILSASVLVYLLPVVALLLGAVAAELALSALQLTAEPLIILMAFTCAGATFWAVRRHMQANPNADFYPRLLGVLPKDTQSVRLS